MCHPRDLSPISTRFAAHFDPPSQSAAPYSGRMDTWARTAFLLVLLALGAPARADAPWLADARALVLRGAGAPAALRVEVQFGTLDARLRLAPCEQIEPYLPTNTKLWGRSRIGLRCLRGPTRWNVYLPVTIKAFGPALVATRALPAGSVLAEGDLAQAEIDLAEDSSPVLRPADAAVGRTLARALDVGAGLRQAHLQPRQWFAAGTTVQVIAQGSGFAVAGEGQAISAGIEGQLVRVRTENGRVLSGTPVGERRVEVNL